MSELNILSNLGLNKLLTLIKNKFDTKVDKEQGKGLSTNNYTNEEKNKLTNIEENANRYTLPVGGASIGGVKNGGDIAIDGNGNMTVGNGKITAGKITTDAITTTKIKNANVTRAKLANDALYSPVIAANANVTINASHCGKTLRASKGSDAKIDITLTYNTSNPVGMEFAVLNIWTKRTRIVAGTNAKLLLSDGSAPSSVVVPSYGMAAAKLITRNTSTPYDQWYITGNVEVV